MGDHEVPELFYFPAPSRGCLPRLCFAAGGVEFTNTEVFPPQLPALKESGVSAFGSVPCLRHRGVSIVQWQAIASYAAEIALNSGELTAMQRAQDLMLCGTYEDVLSANMKGAPVNSGRDEAYHAAAVTTLIAKFFPPLEAMLPADGWLHGREKPSLGDLAIFAIMSYCHPKYGPAGGWQELAGPGWQAPFPKMCACRDRVRALPQLKAYFEKYGKMHAIA